MKPIFGPIDHPFIIIAQAVCAFALFRYFFLITREKQPIPQIVAALAFGVLSNLTARVIGAGWFWIVDIVQYTLGAILIVTTVLGHQKATENGVPRMVPVATPVVLFFDSWRNRISWALGVIICGLVIYSYVKSYNEQSTAAITENTRVTKQYTEVQQDASAARDSILEDVDSLKKLQIDLVKKVDSLSSGLTPPTKPEPVKPRLINRPKASKPTLQPTPVPQTNADDIPTPEKKKGFFRRIFGHRATADDSLFHVRATGADQDTLVLH